ncbi:acyl-CoA dehydrogenase [Streptomyces sp. p1417]|uniref:Acyl-CoA dehydrogenase n=1 Tax=Streptomyces typhae TaxID=2681492 RepID=A0A6L6WUW7_9ACTN|nr:acyl-CoA dehydrogenase family protein [Streptomyces typhae]MVO86072.1 acyl-CoA dehydrogenase [Streptomyces typhae]
MDAACTAEQDEIRRTLRAALAERCGPDDVKAAVRTPAGYDGALWAVLAKRLGLPGLALPERYGGVGCGPVDSALAAEELGRALAPTPLLATAGLAAPVLLAHGTPRQQADHLPRIAAGDLTATLAVPGAALATALGLVGGGPGDWAGGGLAGGVQARAEGAGWRLYGQVDQVLDGHTAELVLVAAHTGGYARSRTLLFLVRGCAPGLVRVRQTALDETRPRARLELRDVGAELVGEDTADGGGAAALGRVGDQAAVLLAAEAVGAADHALARTVAHVKEREQFGRPIGSFQAVKHRLADVYVAVQAARSAAYYAAWAAGAGRQEGCGQPEEGGRQEGCGQQEEGGQPEGGGEGVGGLALAHGLDALRRAAAEAVQFHGGIGFTWEHDAHLYVKRAAGDELLFGPVHRLRAHAAERAGLFGGTGSPGGAGARKRGAPAVRVAGAGV